MVRFSFYCPLLFLIVFVSITNADESGRQDLFEFEFKDQFGEYHRLEDYTGKIVIVFGSDREGSEYNRLWATPLADSLKTVGKFDDVVILGVANLEKVPAFLRFVVEKMLPKDDPHNKILLDWEGQFAWVYHFENKRSNILVFGPNLKLQFQLAETIFNKETFQNLFGIINNL